MGVQAGERSRGEDLWDLSQALKDKKNAESLEMAVLTGESGRRRDICRESGSMIVLE